MTIKSKIRSIKDFPKRGINFRDISTLFSDPEGIKILISSFYEEYKNRDDIDLIVGIESRGFIVGSLIAGALNKGFVMIRKPGKLPSETIAEEYSLEYGTDAIEMHIDAINKHDKVLIVDDLLATGGTAKATGSVVEKLQGEILSYAFLIILKGLKGDELLKPVPVFNILEY